MDARSTSRSTSTPVTKISFDSSQSSYSDMDDYESSTTPSTSAVPSLLDKLRPPKKSDLARKRKILRNRSHHQGKHFKRPNCSSNPKSVTPLQRVREFDTRNWLCQLESFSVRLVGRS